MDSHFLIEQARILVENAPKRIGAQSQLTDGVRDLIIEMADRIHELEMLRLKCN